MLTASSIFGAFFEAIKQPVLNGYILAGSLVGPDGLALVKELVQVESLAQVWLRPCWPPYCCLRIITRAAHAVAPPARVGPSVPFARLPLRCASVL